MLSNFIFYFPPTKVCFCWGSVSCCIMSYFSFRVTHFRRKKKKLFALTKELRHKFITKQKSFQCIGLRKFPIRAKEMQLQVNCTEPRE